jgi:geranylgeranyl diphosphate synthase, type II
MRTLPDYQSFFQTYLTENEFIQDPQELYEPVNYILSIGGKRLRPLLALMGCDLFSPENASITEGVSRALPVAMAVEVFHNFTLLHDDIMDEAPLRRGMPTVHIKYNINTGILSGDVMLILAYDFLMKTEGSAKMKMELVEIFTRMATEVCDGQQMDMNFEKRADVSLLEYLKMIELKTSVLIAAAFQMGALVAGAKPAVAKRLYEFGRNVGVAFQIQDDILDSFGDPEKFGKKVGGDIVQNKKTYLVLKALQRGSARQKMELQQLMNTPTSNETAKIAAVKKIFEATRAREFAEKEMDKHLQEAFKNLEKTPLSIERKNYLKSWANDLMMREK